RRRRPHARARRPAGRGLLLVADLESLSGAAGARRHGAGPDHGGETRRWRARRDDGMRRSYAWGHETAGGGGDGLLPRRPLRGGASRKEQATLRRRAVLSVDPRAEQAERERGRTGAGGADRLSGPSHPWHRRQGV